MSDTTKWLDGEPTIPGVYQRKFSFGVYYARWDGSHWYTSSKNLLLASHAVVRSAYPELPWRGLKVKA